MVALLRPKYILNIMFEYFYECATVIRMWGETVNWVLTARGEDNKNAVYRVMGPIG